MRYPLVSRVESLDLKYSRIEKTSRVFRDRELLLLPLSISPVSLSLFLCLVVGPQWNVATLVFPDGAARRVCVRVSGTVCQLVETGGGGTFGGEFAGKRGLVSLRHNGTTTATLWVTRELTDWSLFFFLSHATRSFFFFPRCTACLCTPRTFILAIFRAFAFWPPSVHIGGISGGLRTRLEAEANWRPGIRDDIYDKIHFSRRKEKKEGNFEIIISKIFNDISFIATVDACNWNKYSDNSGNRNKTSIFFPERCLLINRPVTSFFQ